MQHLKKIPLKSIALFLALCNILFLGYPLFEAYKGRSPQRNNAHIPVVVLADNGTGQLLPAPGALVEVSYFQEGSDTPDIVDSIRTNRHGRGVLPLVLEEGSVIKLDPIVRNRRKNPKIADSRKRSPEQQIFIGVGSEEIAENMISEAKSNNEFLLPVKPFPDEDTVYIGAPHLMDHDIIYVHVKNSTQSGKTEFSVSQKKTASHPPIRESGKEKHTKAGKNKSSFMPGSEEDLYFANYNNDYSEPQLDYNTESHWDPSREIYQGDADHLYEYNNHMDDDMLPQTDESMISYHDQTHLPERNCIDSYSYEYFYNYCPCNEENICGCGEGEEPLEVTEMNVKEVEDELFCVTYWFISCRTKAAECDGAQTTSTPSPTSSPVPTTSPYTTPAPTYTSFPTPEPSPTPVNQCSSDSECEIGGFSSVYPRVCCKQEGETFGVCTEDSFCCNKKRQNQQMPGSMTTTRYCCATSCDGDYQIVDRGRGFRCPHKNNGNRELACVIPQESCSPEMHNKPNGDGTKACCDISCNTENNLFWVNTGEGRDCSDNGAGHGNPVSDGPLVTSNGNLAPHCLKPEKCDCEWLLENSSNTCMGDSSIADIVQQTMGIPNSGCNYQQTECSN